MRTLSGSSGPRNYCLLLDTGIRAHGGWAQDWQLQPLKMVALGWLYHAVPRMDSVVCLSLPMALLSVTLAWCTSLVELRL
jgi:hypothetical protein